MEEALLKAGKVPAFRKDWEDLLPEQNAFEQMFSGEEVLEDVKVQSDRRREIMSVYKRLAHEAPKWLDRVSTIVGDVEDTRRSDSSRTVNKRPDFDFRTPMTLLI